MRRGIIAFSHWTDFSLTSISLGRPVLAKDARRAGRRAPWFLIDHTPKHPRPTGRPRQFLAAFFRFRSDAAVSRGNPLRRGDLSLSDLLRLILERGLRA